MRLLVCGGRDFTDSEFGFARIEQLHEKKPVTTLICGMARGGDAIGLAWARKQGIAVDEYHPDWGTLGPKAGPIRNQQMLDEGKPDVVLGLPGQKGTAHMLRISRAAGVEVVECRRLYFSQARDSVTGFLSNFYAHEQDVAGILYPTNEHYYQAEKTLDPATRQWIAESPDPTIAKRRGNTKSLPLREDWDSYKIKAMMTGLRAKFLPGTPLADRLLATGNDYLIEFAPWGDTFWGVDRDRKGLNWLGRLLMRRRDELARLAR
jgi:ribA/ribD-fused uncharacterized protein